LRQVIETRGRLLPAGALNCLGAIAVAHREIDERADFRGRIAWSAQSIELRNFVFYSS
jgi:hypothetical protein